MSENIADTVQKATDLHEQALRIATSELLQVCLITYDHLNTAGKNVDVALLQKQAEIFSTSVNFLKYTTREAR